MHPPDPQAFTFSLNIRVVQLTSARLGAYESILVIVLYFPGTILNQISRLIEQNCQTVMQKSNSCLTSQDQKNRPLMYEGYLKLPLFIVTFINKMF